MKYNYFNMKTSVMKNESQVIYTDNHFQLPKIDYL